VLTNLHRTGPRTPPAAALAMPLPSSCLANLTSHGLHAPPLRLGGEELPAALPLSYTLLRARYLLPRTLHLPFPTPAYIFRALHTTRTAAASACRLHARCRCTLPLHCHTQPRPRTAPQHPEPRVRTGGSSYHPPAHMEGSHPNTGTAWPPPPRHTRHTRCTYPHAARATATPPQVCHNNTAAAGHTDRHSPPLSCLQFLAGTGCGQILCRHCWCWDIASSRPLFLTCTTGKTNKVVAPRASLHSFSFWTSGRGTYLTVSRCPPRPPCERSHRTPLCGVGRTPLLSISLFRAARDALYAHLALVRFPFPHFTTALFFFRCLRCCEGVRLGATSPPDASQTLPFLFSIHHVFHV